MSISTAFIKGAKTAKSSSKVSKGAKASEKNIKSSSKVSKGAKAESLLNKGKKAYLKHELKEKIRDWLFSPEDSIEQDTAENVEKGINNTQQSVKTLKRVKGANTKERSDKGASHWRKDGDIEKASKYRYTIDLDKAIQQDKSLKNINERLDSALYAISGNIPNVKGKTKQTQKKETSARNVKSDNPASEQSIQSLTKSIDVLNDNLRKSKQTVTEESAQKLLVSNAKIDTLLKKISDDMTDEQDTRIKPVDHSSESNDEKSDEVKVPRASFKNLIKRAENSSLIKSLITAALIGLAPKMIDWFVKNFIEDGHFTLDIIKDKLENWFSEKYDLVKSWIEDKYNSIKDWVSETFNFDNIVNSIKDWFTADPVAALGEGFIATLAGYSGLKLTKSGIDALRASNAKTGDKKPSKEEIKKTSEKSKVKDVERPKVSSKNNLSKMRKTSKFAKVVPGLGAAFAVMDVINAVTSYIRGDTDQAEQSLVSAGVSAIEAIPGVGTTVAVADLVSTFFTGKSFSDRLYKGMKSINAPEQTALEELHNSNAVEKGGWFSKDKIKDKQVLEMTSADYIAELIETGDWSDDDLKYLNELYTKKKSETSDDFEKRREQIIDKIKEIGVQYHKDQNELLKACQLYPDLAKVLKDSEQSNDKVGYSKVIKGRFGNNIADVYRRAQLALKTAFNLGHSVNLENDEIEKLLKIGKYDKKYLDENQEILKASDENSKEFKDALDNIIETEKQHSEDGADYDLQIRKEMMSNPEYFHTNGGTRSEFDNSGKPQNLGGPVGDYKGNFKTVGGDAIQVSDEIKGPYAQRYSKIRGLRNNNPGNIRLTNIKWAGKIPREKNTDRSFEQFCAPEFGIRALAMNAKNYQIKQNLWTPRAMIWKWAPPNENNTDKYVQDVIRIFHQSGYGPARNITADTSFTMTDPELAYCMVCGIILKECGINPYPDSLIKRAINSALGKESLMTKTQADVTMSQTSDMSNSVAFSPDVADNADPEGKSNNFGVMQSSSTMPSSVSGVAGDYLQTATALANDATGYSQSNRLGESQYDCSSFVSRTLKQCGFDINPSTTTHTLRNTLTDLGFNYTPVNDIQGDYSMLQPGDILLNDRNRGDNHTEFYMGNGWSVGAHSQKSGVSARPNNIDVYHYNGFLRHNGSAPENVDNPAENDIMSTVNTNVTPFKDTTKSDMEVMQTSEGISRAVTNSEPLQPVHVSNNLTSVENAQEQEVDITSQNMFDANIVNTDFASMQFSF